MRIVKNKNKKEEKNSIKINKVDLNFLWILEKIFFYLYYI